MAFQNPSPSEIKALLQRVKTVAVVGLSTDPDRPSYSVAMYLQQNGYRIVPVRPGGGEILGEKVYERLSDIPFAEMREKMEAQDTLGFASYSDRIADTPARRKRATSSCCERFCAFSRQCGTNIMGLGPKAPDQPRAGNAVDMHPLAR